ncbi:uncharacterized protein STAUR_5673 [Stigmatella aurantiaca DW4/3-1]|nr:uncharacterized protein STAUR_5673 [Stigmatella aurantiaca DW4/3-1]
MDTAASRNRKRRDPIWKRPIMTRDYKSAACSPAIRGGVIDGDFSPSLRLAHGKTTFEPSRGDGHRCRPGRTIQGS